MAKYKRVVIGSVYKGQKNDDGSSKPDYMKLRCDQITKDQLVKAIQNADPAKGLVVQLQSKQSQLQGITEAVANQKMSEETAAQIRERIEKIPDYVRFELVLLQTN